MVGDGVVPDPSIAPEPEITEPEISVPEGTDPGITGTGVTEPDDSPLPEAGMPTVSVAPTHHEHKTFHPDKVRATQPQDPAKAGAQHPDGTQVGVVGLRPQYERHGGLAKTGW